MWIKIQTGGLINASRLLGIYTSETKEPETNPWHVIGEPLTDGAVVTMGRYPNEERAGQAQAGIERDLAAGTLFHAMQPAQEQAGGVDG